ncbi:MAG: tetratricopeptide repeat protein [Pirellulaceae bacterium]|nr:tetratricopeptide repeat protein [Pirellulaceae bacterium]
MTRSGKLKGRRRPGGSPTRAPATPRHAARYWPRVVLIALCLVLAGFLAVRLSRPPAPSAVDDGVQTQRADAPTPDTSQEAASAVRLTLQELLDAARRLAEQLETTLPDNADALNLAATIHHELFQDNAKALACWERTLAARPNSPEVHFNVGYAALKSGDYERALLHLDRAYTLNPDLGEVRYCLAESLVKLGEAERAIGVLEETGNPQRFGAKGCLTLGQAYALHGDFAKAQAQFEAALALDPKLLPAHHALVKVLVRLKQLEKARLHRDAATKLEQAYRGSALTDRSSEVVQISLEADYVVWWLDVFYRSAAEVFRRQGRFADAEDMRVRAARLASGIP